LYGIYGYSGYPFNGYGVNSLYSGIQQYGREFTVPRVPVYPYYGPYIDILKK
jgi:hypothetical protein